jgi:hypothetical protein
MPDVFHLGGMAGTSFKNPPPPGVLRQGEMRNPSQFGDLRPLMKRAAQKNPPRFGARVAHAGIDLRGRSSKMGLSRVTTAVPLRKTNHSASCAFNSVITASIARATRVSRRARIEARARSALRAVLPQPDFPLGGMRSTLDIRGGEAECPLLITEQIGINRAWTSVTLRGHPPDCENRRMV